MKTHPMRLRLALLTLLALALGLGAASGDVYRHNEQERSVDADFYFEDASGCIYTSIIVFVDRERTPEGGSTGYMGLFRADRCAGDRALLNVRESLTPAPGEMSFQGHLASATLTTTFEAFDAVSGSTRTVHVDLLWTATDRTYQSLYRAGYFVPDYRFTLRQHGMSRPAQATGSILIDGEEMILGPSSDAAITDSKVWSIEVYD